MMTEGASEAIATDLAILLILPYTGIRREAIACSAFVISIATRVCGVNTKGGKAARMLRE